MVSNREQNNLPGNYKEVTGKNLKIEGHSRSVRVPDTFVVNTANVVSLQALNFNLPDKRIITG